MGFRLQGVRVGSLCPYFLYDLVILKWTYLLLPTLRSWLTLEYLLYSDAIHCLVWSCLYSSSEQAEQNESCQGRFSSDVFHLPHE